MSVRAHARTCEDVLINKAFVFVCACLRVVWCVSVGGLFIRHYRYRVMAYKEKVAYEAVIVAYEFK